MAESTGPSKGKAKSSNSKGKTFDVSHPGKSAPSATSRPVIIGHGPMLQDPMVQAASGVDVLPRRTKVAVSEDAAEEVPIQDSPSAKSARSGPEKVIEAPEALKAEVASAAEDTPPEESADDEPATQAPAAPDGSGSSDNEEAVVDSVAEQAADKKQQSEAEKKAAEQAAHVAELIENKTYFVPINVAKRRRSNRAALIVLGALIFGVLAGVFVYLSGTL